MKNAGSKLTQDRAELLLEIMGHQGLGWEGEGFSQNEIESTRAWLGGKAVTIYGGTYEIQNNIIAKRDAWPARSSVIANRDGRTKTMAVLNEEQTMLRDAAKSLGRRRSRRSPPSASMRDSGNDDGFDRKVWARDGRDGLGRHHRPRGIRRRRASTI